MNNLIEQSIKFYRKFNAWHSMLFSLLILAAAGVYRFGISQTLPQLSGALIAATIVETAAVKLHYKKWALPISGWITALITAMVLPHGLGFFPLALVVTITLLIKHLFRPMGRHVFNPAALAIVLAAALYKVHPGWWSEAYYIVTIPLGLYVTYRIRKFWQVGAYLVTYSIIGAGIILFTEGFSSIQFSIPYMTGIVSGIPWFFALFMVPEPRTSPSMRNNMIAYGAIAAVTGVFVPLLSPIVNGLLFANIINVVHIWYQRNKIQRAVVR